MTSIDKVDPTIQAILRADHLSKETRIGYSKRLALIATAARNQALHPVLTMHPRKVLKWIFRSYIEVGTQRTMLVAILAAYKLLNLKATKQASYAMYLEQYERLDAQLRDRAKDNVPTGRQRAGFVSYLKLQKIRIKLPFGSKERLLLSFYGGTPLRNDLHACAIQLLKCDDDEAAQQALLHQVTNEILLTVDRNSAGALILREFKTQDRKHPVLCTRSLGSELTKELRASLEKDPRSYLFTESNNLKPYTHSAFAMYARRTLQKLFGEPCTLTLLRHSYISHMLAYGQLTIRDREQLAAEMCHSPATQAQYQWVERHTNCMLASHFPERLSVGLITAGYKSGDKFDMGNYTGITVGSVVAKLFAMILEQRIAPWAEEHAVKAKGQARFSKDFLTTDNIFILRSLTDKQKQSRQKANTGKLYCCFVDFNKAFDTVPRAVLWQVLEELGVHGRILDIIKSLYAHDSAAVRSSQGISAIFRCLMGVKQGCPLSSTLFNLYVDGLEKHLLETADINAPTLMGVMVPLLLYADDVILMSQSASGLQKQLDALASSCEQRYSQSQQDESCGL